MTIYELADFLHGAFCGWGHVEMCAHYYETGWAGNTWDHPSHKKWLAIAYYAVEKFGTMAKVVEIVEEFNLKTLFASLYTVYITRE